MQKYKIFEFIAFCAVLIISLVLSFNPHQNSYFITQNPIIFSQDSSLLPPPNSHILDNDSNYKIPQINEILLPNSAKSSHSSSIVDLGDRLMLVYFAGSKEGASDVKIMSHFIDKQTLDYTPQREILSAKSLSSMTQKFVKKLGNPVIFKDNLGNIHLFVVGVSLGGWATSKIYQLKFSSDLSHLEFKSELKLGLLANFSHLVRTPAIMLENGGFMLPIYHELARKYPLVAFFDNNANLKSTQRLNTLKNQLQPTIIALNESECLAFFRNHKAYKNTSFLQKCKNSGETWESPQPTNLKAYDDSYLLLSYKNENNKRRILLLYNDGKGNENGVKYNNSRRKLSLYILRDSTQDSSNTTDSTNSQDSTIKLNNNSQDSARDSHKKLDSNDFSHNNHHFTFLRNIDSVDEAYPNEVSYPSAIIADVISKDSAKSYLFIAYTHNRKQIKLQKLDLSLLETQILSLENASSQNITFDSAKSYFKG